MKHVQDSPWSHLQTSSNKRNSLRLFLSNQLEKSTIIFMRRYKGHRFFFIFAKISVWTLNAETLAHLYTCRGIVVFEGGLPFKISILWLVSWYSTRQSINPFSKNLRFRDQYCIGKNIASVAIYEVRVGSHWLHIDDCGSTNPRPMINLDQKVSLKKCEAIKRPQYIFYVMEFIAETSI